MKTKKKIALILGIFLSQVCVVVLGLSNPGGLESTIWTKIIYAFATEGLLLLIVIPILTMIACFMYVGGCWDE